ncbi:hypothetical protein GQ55_5G392500 [Panicum hallii var. hallii]|uniref:Uncharacterized protein n=1 Tax=Panicum hallii var. hallii TaxID=1504633 RepID=A0A2T7DN46_9POAL|nr:hypothetical protein GQ55_5G392500 [Panicum hallii var. hallii]
MCPSAGNCRKDSSASDTVSALRPLRGDGTLVSAKGKFEMGFFSPGSSGRFYLPIVFYGVANGAGVERRGDARQRQSGPRQWEQLLPCAVAEAW